ncbi:MAG: SIS domain-containing protein [Pseudomonadota bacterium]
MRDEIDAIPSAVEHLLTRGQDAIDAVCRSCDLQALPFLVSVARGSSDHACTYLKYVSEIVLGLPLASIGPSVASLYEAPLRVHGALCLAVSQSGQSPDSVAMTQALAAGGGYTVAITNDAASPLAQVARATLPLHVGEEISVAATKTYVASVVAGVWLIAALARDRDLIDALRDLPQRLDAARHCDWGVLQHALTGRSVFTLGRGVGLAVSHEAALKCKETCQMHAESFSSAEVLHGPVSLVDQAFPIVAFAGRDQTEDSVVAVADRLAASGATVFVTSQRAKRAWALPVAGAAHPLLDPLTQIVSFYSLVERLARARGVDPDAPRHLRKVTHTL